VALAVSGPIDAALGFFEDVFPTTAELEAVIAEAMDVDVQALRRRDTHHDHGLSGAASALRSCCPFLSTCGRQPLSRPFPG